MTDKVTWSVVEWCNLAVVTRSDDSQLIVRKINTPSPPPAAVIGAVLLNGAVHLVPNISESVL